MILFQDCKDALFFQKQKFFNKNCLLKKVKSKKSKIIVMLFW